MFTVIKFKCGGNCNNINDPKLCVPDAFKNINVKVFNLMSRTNEKTNIPWYKTCKCKCVLDESVCNNKQKRNEGKYRCECKELIDNVYVILDLFGILVIANASVMNHVIYLRIFGLFGL